MRPDGEPEYLSPIDPRALLRHALGRINAPDAEETDYRRAVSDAFYALYHALTLAAAPSMTASTDPLDPYRQVRRIRHWHVRDAINTAGASTDELVQLVATTMLALYRWRKSADYDHLTQFTHARAGRLISRAGVALEVVMAPAFAEGDGGQSLLRQLAARPDAP